MKKRGRKKKTLDNGMILMFLLQHLAFVGISQDMLFDSEIIPTLFHVDYCLAAIEPQAV